MLTRAVKARPLEPARLAIRRALARRHLHAVIAGKSDTLKIDLQDGEINSSALLIELMAPLDNESLPFRQIASAIKRSGRFRRTGPSRNSRHASRIATHE